MTAESHYVPQNDDDLVINHIKCSCGLTLTDLTHFNIECDCEFYIKWVGIDEDDWFEGYKETMDFDDLNL